jgi:hypothetical protein
LAAWANFRQNEQSLKLVEELASPEFTFYRPIQGQGRPDQRKDGVAIFGSVSRREIADQIKASVTRVKEAAAIRLDESNVEIFEDQAGEKPLRIVKTTGHFTIAITYPDLGRKVYRKITVSQGEAGQEAAPSG